MKILIADDDPQIVRALRITLGGHGYDVVTAGDGRAAITAASETSPDLILLDLGMPRLDGVAVIHALRAWTEAPIIVVSGRTGSADKVEALDAGADDFVTKPFNIGELLARLRALSRRAAPASEQATVKFGDVEVDLATKLVTRGGESVHLTPTEWRVLELLCRHPGKLVTRQELLQNVWGVDESSDSSYIRLYLSQLRRKLERTPSEPKHLITESGMGYRLVVDPPPAP